jgi:hypothetical protein
LQDAREWRFAPGGEHPSFEVIIGLMNRTSASPLLGFTLLWWALTGTLSGIVVTRIVRHLDAQRRFRATEGTVVKSAVGISRGRKSTQYTPQIHYRYAVDGKELLGDLYSFDTTGETGRTFADQVVAAHPPGKVVTVYYDPEHPETAILTLPVPNGLWGQLLFAQPFLAMGIALFYAVLANPFAVRRARQFLLSPPDLPWEIPGWGRMELSPSGWTVHRRTSGFRLAGGAYLIVSFVSAAIVLLWGRGFSSPPRWVIFSGFVVPVVPALVIFFKLAGGVARTVTLDSSAGTLTVTSRKGARGLRLADIEEVTVGRPLKTLYIRRGFRRVPAHPRLGAILQGGEIVELNRFVIAGDADGVARKAGEEVARTAGRPFRVEDRPSG